MAGVLTMAVARREIEDEHHGACTPTLRVAQSPLGTGASPFRNFLGLLKPPPLPTSYSGESRESSPRASFDSAESSLTLNLGGDGGRREGQSVVMVAFDGSVKEVSHTGIVWAMENVLKRGDVLAIVSIIDSVRGPLGYRVRIGDTGNQKVVEEEVQQRMEAWRSFPGLERRCEEGGVTLQVTVKPAPRIEVAIGKEAFKLGASHVVLDKSMKNRHRTFYATNLTCDVTRMRRSGGVDVIRPTMKWVPEPPSPTSVIPQRAPLLSYGDQIDEFEIALKTLPKRKPVPKAFPKLERLQLPTTDERCTTSAASTASTPSVRASSTTSSSNAEDGMDDDLFSIFHGSARHDGVSTSSPSSGYESDDLFSIGEVGSARRPPFHSHHHSTSSLPDTGEPEPLQQATMARIKLVGGVGEAMTLTLQSPLRPGEGLLVGSSPSALFLMHTDNQSGSTTLSTATPSSYIAMEGQMAMKLSFLEPEQRVLAVDSQGRCRTIRVENAGAHKKPLVLVEAQCEGRRHSVLLHHADTVGALLPHHSHHAHHAPSLPNHGAQSPVHGVVAVKGLKVGDRVLLRLRSAEPTHAIWS